MKLRLLPELCATAGQGDLGKIAFDKLVSTKLDGIRALNLGYGVGLVSRYLKPIANRALRAKFGAKAYWYLDGELIHGNPTDPEAFNRTQSVVSTRDAPADGVKFYVWDYLGDSSAPYRARYATLRHREAHRLPGVMIVRQRRARDLAELLVLEDAAVRAGYEGVVARDPEAPHKDGRWTLKQQGVIKVKRFLDSEAVVLDVLPRYKNTNKAKRDNLGHVKRSSHQAGKVSLEELGKLRARDVKSGVVFDCAPGKLTQLQRQVLWTVRAKLKGEQFTYRHQPAGAKDLPRFPRFYRWRSKGL